MMKPRSLEILRGKMKEKDKEIIRLLNERSQISVQIGKVKGEGGIQVYDPSQEAKVYNYLQELNSGPLRPAAVKAIFRDFWECFRLGLGLRFPNRYLLRNHNGLDSSRIRTSVERIFLI